MGPITSVFAGIATIGGIIALTRLAQRKAGEIRETIDEFNRPERGSFNGAVLDYERDPADGVYRAKP